MVQDPQDEEDSLALMQEDLQRSLMALPSDALRAMIRKSSPDLSPTGGRRHVAGARLRESARSARGAAGERSRRREGGSAEPHDAGAQFEMALYLAQATGSAIVTDSPSRWDEMRRTLFKPTGWSGTELPALASKINKATRDQSGNDGRERAAERLLIALPRPGMLDARPGRTKLVRRPDYRPRLTASVSCSSSLRAASSPSSVNSVNANQVPIMSSTSATRA